MPWCHPDYSLADTQAWVEKQITSFEEGDEFHFVIVSNENGIDCIVGGCGLNGIQRENRLANLGYWVRSSHARQGIATQATQRIADWAFQNTELERLEILVSIGNHPSLRVAAKAGAVWEGVLRGRLRLHDKLHDAVMFSIMRGEH